MSTARERDEVRAVYMKPRARDRILEVLKASAKTNPSTWLSTLMLQRRLTIVSSTATSACAALLADGLVEQKRGDEEHGAVLLYRFKAATKPNEIDEVKS